MKIFTYGIGGYDPSKPNNNLLEEIDIPDEETPNEESIDASNGSILSGMVSK